MGYLASDIKAVIAEKDTWKPLKLAHPTKIKHDNNFISQEEW